MTSIPGIVRYRQRRRSLRRNNPLFRFGWISGLFVSLVLVSFVAVAAQSVSLLFQDLPSLDALPLMLDTQEGTLLNPTQLYDRSGARVIATLQLPGAEREWITLDRKQERAVFLDRASPIIRASLQASQPAFFSDHGLRISDLFANRPATIAERLARNLLLWKDPGGLRKVWREKILGGMLLSRFGQEKVLEWFLNSSSYGPGVNGVGTASRLYFDKSPDQLNLVEAAALAVTAETPGLNPINAPDIVRQKTGGLLAAMLRAGVIKPEEIESIDLNRLHYTPGLQSLPSVPDQAIIDQVLDQVNPVIPIERVEAGGLRIITSIDLDVQANVDCLLTWEVQLNTQPSGSQPPADCAAALLLPTLSANNPLHADQLSFSIAVLDPQTGQVLAYGGQKIDQAGSNVTVGHFPNLKHTTGTILTPFLYLSGFTHGYSPASLVWDIPPDVESEGVTNLDGNYHGPVRTRLAIANDYLSPINKLFTHTGSENITKILNGLGISLEFSQQGAGELTADQVLRMSQATLLQVSQAYAALANQGTMAGWRNEPNDQSSSSEIAAQFVLSVTDEAGMASFGSPDGNDGAVHAERPVVTNPLAYLMTNVLSDETARWPSLGHPNPLEIGRPAAVKIGRLAGNSATWVVGYTAKKVVGVWVGTEASEDQNDLDTTSLATAIWHAVMQQASHADPIENWTKPAGVSEVEVCDPSGMLPTKDCQQVVKEVFLDGSEPHQLDNLYQTFMINSDTGLLATVFTPPEFIQEKRYLIVPAEAVAWATQAGLPVPPDSYDIIQPGSNSSETAHITSPSMFSYVRGQAEITGSAGGAGFNSYHLQSGQGLNPHQWIKVGEEGTTPVKESKLGSWDTQGLSGLYTLQLQVVGSENRVETAMIQVTVDNNPPDVQVVYPDPNQVFSLKDNPVITFQIQPVDDLGIAKVEVSLDGKLLQTILQSPYAYPWKASAGSHKFKVIAYDLAGNSKETALSFNVSR